MSSTIELIVLSDAEARPLYSLASTYVYVHPSCGDVPEDLLDAMRVSWKTSFFATHLEDLSQPPQSFSLSFCACVLT